MPAIATVTALATATLGALARAVSETPQPNRVVKSSNADLYVVFIIGGSLLGGAALIAMTIWMIRRGCGKCAKKYRDWRDDRWLRNFLRNNPEAGTAPVPAMPVVPSPAAHPAIQPEQIRRQTR